MTSAIQNENSPPPPQRELLAVQHNTPDTPPPSPVIAVARSTLSHTTNETVKPSLMRRLWNRLNPRTYGESTPRSDEEIIFQHFMDIRRKKES